MKLHGAARGRREWEAHLEASGDDWRERLATAAALERDGSQAFARAQEAAGTAAGTAARAAEAAETAAAEPAPSAAREYGAETRGSTADAARAWRCALAVLDYPGPVEDSGAAGGSSAASGTSTVYRVHELRLALCGHLAALALAARDWPGGDGWASQAVGHADALQRRVKAAAAAAANPAVPSPALASDADAWAELAERGGTPPGSGLRLAGGALCAALRAARAETLEKLHAQALLRRGQARLRQGQLPLGKKDVSQGAKKWLAAVGGDKTDPLLRAAVREAKAAAAAAAAIQKGFSSL